MTCAQAPVPRWRIALPSRCASFVALALLAWALPASAQVYKCVDKAGRTTYQQQPCPGTQKGARMDLPINNGSVQDDASDEDWAGRAERKEVIAGMPRAFVVQALGAPQEMRTGRAQENATEVWRYRRKDLDLSVGFNKGAVAWTRPTSAEEPDVAPDAEPSRRQNFFVSRKCVDLEVEAGAPSTVYEEMDETLARRVKRQVWEAEPGDRERTIVTCADGTVMRVDRIQMR